MGVMTLRWRGEVYPVRGLRWMLSVLDLGQSNEVFHTWPAVDRIWVGRRNTSESGPRQLEGPSAVLSYRFL